MEVFQTLNEERRMTVILVTHEPDIAEYAKRVITFQDGRIRSDLGVETRRHAREVLLGLPTDDSDSGEDSNS
jgi:putative ABC transport system ATP-binding protein